MSVKIVLLKPPRDPRWPELFVEDDFPDRLRARLAGVNLRVYPDAVSAAGDIVDADAVIGTVPPDIFARAKKLRWIAAPGGALGPSWYYDALAASDVEVTTIRGISNEHLAAHCMAFILAFARRLDHYLRLQAERRWEPGELMIGLDQLTVMIVGVGGAGAETARLAAAFGMRVIGVDPRVTGKTEGVAELITPEKIDARIGEADVVVSLVPETPDTAGMFDARRFALMKKGSRFINVGRGRTVVADDLAAAIRGGHLAGAGLDVTDPEPLPPDHPLWTMKGVMITPHIAVWGAPNTMRREAQILENCRRFAAGEQLLNVADKRKWF